MKNATSTEISPEYTNIRLKASTKSMISELKFKHPEMSSNLIVLDLVRCYKMFGTPINEETDPEYER